MRAPYTAQLRFDFAPLEPLLRAELPELCERNQAGSRRITPAADGARVAALLGVSRRQVCRWRAGAPMTSTCADRAATALGWHPALIWDTWDALHDDALEVRRARWKELAS